MNIIFFGTPEFSVPSLKALVEDEQFNVQLVVTQPPKAAGRGKKETPSPISRYAEEAGIEVFAPRTLKDEEVQNKINSYGADVYVIVAYGKIIPEAIFDHPPYGSVNVHYSLLPELRGAAPVQGALLQGKEKTGVTLFRLVEELDKGPIISQEEEEVGPTDTFLTLAPRLQKIGVEMLVRDLPAYVAGEIKPVEQDHSAATFFGMIKKEDGRVDWARSAEHIYNQWRAFIAWPGTYTFTGDKRLTLKEVTVANIQPDARVGELIAHEKKLFVQCGTGVLEILQIQPEGKASMSAVDFMNGYQHLLGTQLS